MLGPVNELESCPRKAQSDHARVSMRETALFLLPLSRKVAEASHTARRTQAKSEGWRSSFRGHNRQPTTPRGVVLMAPISLPRMPGWGKPAAWLPSARDPPPSPVCGLWGLVFVGPAHGTPANRLPDGHRDIMSYVFKATGKRLACDLCTTVLSPYDTHALATTLTALNRRRRHCSARGPSSVHTWVREK